MKLLAFVQFLNFWAPIDWSIDVQRLYVNYTLPSFDWHILRQKNDKNWQLSEFRNGEVCNQKSHEANELRCIYGYVVFFNFIEKSKSSLF